MRQARELEIAGNVILGPGLLLQSAAVTSVETTALCGWSLEVFLLMVLAVCTSPDNLTSCSCGLKISQRAEVARKAPRLHSLALMNPLGPS